MASKKASSANLDKLPKPKKPELVTVSSDFRKAHKWFDEQSKEILAVAKLALRLRLRKGKPKLSDARLQRVIKAHERIQRLLNPMLPLLKRQERLTERLKAHYGHTGITEFDSALGATLVSTSATFALDAKEVKNCLDAETWSKFVEEVLNVELLLVSAREDEFLRSVILRATNVKEIKVAVTAPSSRRGKSGRADAEE